MQTQTEKVHTTLNLSRNLILEARELFKDKSNTEIIHAALEDVIRREKIARHVKKWSGKANIHAHD